MTDRYENIRKALAMGPTPGPWQLSIETPTIIKQDLSSIGLSRGGVLIGSACGHESSGAYPTREQAIANARLIAACDPDTIRALLAERDRLREALHAAAEYIGDRSAGSSTFWDLYDAALAHGR